MFHHDETELDAIILVGSDAAPAERCLGALVAVSLDVPLRTWIIEVHTDVERAVALQHRCVWTHSIDAEVGVAARVNRGLHQGRAQFVLILDGGVAVDANAVRALVRHLKANTELAAVGLGALAGHGHDVRRGAVGPALLVRRDALAHIGGIDERGFAGAQAELEAWCRRAERAGYAVELSRAELPVAAARELRPVAQAAPRLRLLNTSPGSAIERRERTSGYARFVEQREPIEGLRSVLVGKVGAALGQGL